MRFSSPSQAGEGASPASNSSPASRLFHKLKSITNNGKATPAGEAKTSPSSAPSQQQQRISNAMAAAAEGTGSAPTSSSSSKLFRKPSSTPPRTAGGMGSSSSTAAAGGRAMPASKAAAPKPTGAQPSAWQRYRESRLSKVGKWLQIFLVALFFVALYCGDLTPAGMRSTAVFEGFAAQARKASEAVAPYLALPPMPKGLKGLKGIQFPGAVLKGEAIKRLGRFTSTWNKVSDTMPQQVTLLMPRTSPALARGATLFSGDYIYSCLPAETKGKGKGKEAKEAAAEPCLPTFFHLKDDGTLVLARGTTPSKPYRPLWSSKTPKPCDGGCKAKAKGKGSCKCQQGFEASYGKDGALEVVRSSDGKRVWRKRKFWQPKLLRAGGWPLSE